MNKEQFEAALCDLCRKHDVGYAVAIVPNGDDLCVIPIADLNEPKHNAAALAIGEVVQAGLVINRNFILEQVRATEK